MTNNQLERFLTKVSVADNGCWGWTGARMKNGYGQFRAMSLPSALPHRSSYEHFVGEIPGGLEIDHLCKNRACVNPTHLEPVTRGENARRADTRKSEKTRALIGASKVGRKRAPFSAEWRQKLGDASRRRWARHREKAA